MQDVVKKILKSVNDVIGNVNSMQELMDWISDLTQATEVSIEECSIDNDSFWFYDEVNGEVLNRKRSFFSIKGIQEYADGKLFKEQPIIVQPEIGYLGIICQEIDGVMNFLMQAKIEPGNINGVQISPTIQATKSNFTRAHGGKMPPYFEYFEKADEYGILYDQIQSEQGSRFFRKRNRNMLVWVQDSIEILPNYRWMTLGQIKKLMRCDNLVNMDTRTVVSGITYTGTGLQPISDSSLFRHTKPAWVKSLLYSETHEEMLRIYHYINDYKMFHNGARILVPLNHLTTWRVNSNGIYCNGPADFEVRYYDISINGREVQNWTQPLFKAIGSATLGIIMKEIGGIMKILVSARPEIGVFDRIEIGPAIQWTPLHSAECDNSVDMLFRRKLAASEGIIADVKLSEEGGRFYHEENRNVLMEIEPCELNDLPKGYFWASLGTLDRLMQVNNCLNIQLRNLLSLIEW